MDKTDAKPCRLVSSKKSVRPLDKENNATIIRRLNAHVHEIVNQLSIINLCCFKLRGQLIGKIDSNDLKEFDTIEMAVAAVDEMLEQLNQCGKATSSTAQAKSKPTVIRLSSLTNVHHISPRL